jgi:outer membrane protein
MNLRIKNYTLPLTFMLALGRVGGPALKAADTNELASPGQVVQAALAHSHQLKQADQEVRAAEARQKQASAQAMPKLSVDGRAAAYEGLTSTALGPQFEIPAIPERYGAGVGLTQPAYTGGRIAGQKAQAQSQRQAAEKNRLGSESDVIRRALMNYWEWSKAYYVVGSLDSSVERMESLVREMENRQKSGLATDNDVLSTEVSLDQTRLLREDAIRRVALSLASLRNLTGHDWGAHTVPAAPPDHHDPALPPVTNLLQTAWAHRSELAASEFDIRAAEANVRTARADFYPQITLTARYETARPNLVNIPPRDRWEDDAYVGATLGWSVFDWGLTRNRVQEARTRVEQARIRQSQWRDMIELEVRQAIISVESAGAKLLVAERAEKSALRNLEVSQSLWTNGMLRQSELLDAHSRLTAAQFEALSARADGILMRTALDYAIGAWEPGGHRASTSTP